MSWRALRYLVPMDRQEWRIVVLIGVCAGAVAIAAWVGLPGAIAFSFGWLTGAIYWGWLR